MTSPPLSRISEKPNVRCASCAGESFRRSRLQIRDVLPLLLLRTPVRCLTCSKRQRLHWLAAKRAISWTAREGRAPHGEGSWSGWNSSGGESSGTAPGPVGRGSFTALPVRAPIAMPELEGVMLKHGGDLPASGDTLDR